MYCSRADKQNLRNHRLHSRAYWAHICGCGRGGGGVSAGGGVGDGGHRSATAAAPGGESFPAPGPAAAAAGGGGAHFDGGVCLEFKKRRPLANLGWLWRLDTRHSRHEGDSTGPGCGYRVVVRIHGIKSDGYIQLYSTLR